MTDDQWLRAMEKYGNDEESSVTRGRILGGALGVVREGLKHWSGTTLTDFRDWRTVWARP